MWCHGGVCLHVSEALTEFVAPLQCGAWLTRNRHDMPGLADPGGESRSAQPLFGATGYVALFEIAGPVRVLICGIPNAGKSTLGNTLRSKRTAKTGDEAVLADIGRQRAPLLPGGRPNTQKVAEIAIHDFRSGNGRPIRLACCSRIVRSATHARWQPRPDHGFSAGQHSVS